MNDEAFLSAYLKEIGVQTPVSSFLSEAKQSKPETHAVIKQPQAMPATAERQATVTAESSRSQTTTVENATVQPHITEIAEPEPTPFVAQQAETNTLNQPVQSPETTTHTSVITSNDLHGLNIQAQACTACELASSRNQLVFGSGNENADLVFIGDAPGRDEDIAGLPFVGRSGELFDRMLASVSLKRDDVYLMNGVKCRPQHSRDPKPNEFASCERWLVSQLELLEPKLICMLGRVVAQALLNTEASLTELRAGQFSFRGIPVLVLDHPSYLLRSQKNKRRAWQDLNRLQSQYKKLQSV